MNFQIDIDGQIGQYGYSKQYVRQILAQYKGQPVNVRVNSLGGSLDDALDIAARFNEHGDVTVFMFGYCASAATVLALGAKKTVIDENAFYLVHKVMNWVDIWDTLNADQLQDLIDELEKNKRDNEKMDLVLAKMYAKKSGHTANEIMAVLKEAAWLTADEAKNWGFVDEIGTGLKYAPAAIENKLNAFGLPLPKPRENKLSAIDKIKNMFNKNVSAMLTNYLNLNALLKVEGFEDKENSVSMTADQLTAIDNELKANAAAIESLKADNEAKENTIKELQEKVAALENLPGDETKHVEPEVDNAVSAASMYENIKNLI
jgi:ATP-dependent protease ClpP protease subunit